MTDKVANIEDDTSAVMLGDYAPIPLAHKWKEGHVTRKRIVIPDDGKDAVFYMEVTGTTPDTIEYKILSPEEFASSEPQGEVLETQVDEAEPETFDVEDEAVDDEKTKEELKDEDEIEEEETEDPEEEEIPETTEDEEKPEDEPEQKEDIPEDREFEIDDEEAPEDTEQLLAESQDDAEEAEVLPDFDFPYETDAGEPIAGFLIPIDENTSPAFIMVRPTLDSEGKPDESAKEAMARVRADHDNYVDADLQMVIDRIGNDPLTSGE